MLADLLKLFELSVEGCVYLFFLIIAIATLLFCCGGIALTLV